MLQSQEVVVVTKDEVLLKVSEHNASIKISEQEFNRSKADYRQSNATLLPNISLSHTGIQTTNPLMAFGSKLNQEILNQNDFNLTSLNDPSQVQNFATKLEISQPLINVDGAYQRKAAKVKMEAMSLKNKRTSDYLAFQVEKAYMQLQLAYKTIEVLEKALKAAIENKNVAENTYEQGLLQRADVLEVEVRVSEVQNQLLNAHNNLKNTSNYLSYLMNDEMNVILKPTENLTVSAVAFNKTHELSEDRLDIKSMKLVSKAYETLHTADKMSFLPRLNAFGSYELYDHKLFRGDANGYLIGAQLSWNILEGTKRFGKAQKSKAEFEKSKLQYEEYVSKSNLELLKIRRMLLTTENKLMLSKLALDQSKESFRIRSKRFREGLEKASDLLLTESQYAQKQLEYYQTIFEHNFALAYLNFLTKK